MPHAHRQPLLLPLLLLATAPMQALATPATPGEAWVAHDQVLRLPVDAAALPPPEALRAFIGSTEVTPMLRRPGGGVLELAPRALPWPAGEHELVLQDGRDWREIGRWPLKVRTPAGFERSTLQPRLDLGSDGRLGEHRSDGQPLSPRGAYRDGSLQAGVQWQGVRDGLQFDATAGAGGHTRAEQALRWAERGARAPRIDLADYRVALGWDGHRVELGHLAGRQHPLLVQDLARRGVGLQLKTGPASDLALHAVHGSRIVGWDDPLGFSDADHRVQLLSWGLELLPERAGGLRLEAGLLDAAVRPRRDFNAGHLPDAERSRGLTLRLAGSSADQRWRGELALARSRFVNPFDPLLALDGELRPVRPVTRNAGIAELQWQALQAPSDDAQAPTLLLGLRHERAEPLYRSLAASVAADQALSRLWAQAGWRGASLSLQAQQRADNIDRVPTLLRTRTDEHQATLQLPLARWLGAAEGPSTWPSLNAGWQQVHQRAVNLPPADQSGFAASQRPDQVQTQAQLALAWQLPMGSFNWGLQQGRLDNRQPGRENADQRQRAEQWQLGWTLNERWQAQAGAQRGRQHNLETAVTQRTRGLTLGLDGRPDDRWTLGAQLALQQGRDGAGLSRTRSLQGQLQLARRFDLPGIDKKLPAQWTLRLGHQAERQQDARFGIDLAWRGWWLDLGLAVGFF